MKSSFAGQNYENIASFGIGEKSPLKKIHCESPEPGSYQLKSEFDKNVEKELGFSFGIGHQHYQKVYNESIGPKYGWTEPGLYNIGTFVDQVKKKNIKFGSRVNMVLEDQ